MDGVDIAVLETDGRCISGFGKTAYRPFTAAERSTLRAALGQWPGESAVPAAEAVIEAAHIEAMAGLTDVAGLGFHGQTLAHDPKAGRTHQAGSGARLSAALGLPVIWDFRSRDMALGGQGAPLAPFYHWALARFIGASQPVAFLNLGGVGNITWVDPNAPGPEAEGAALAFDTGPANAPMDDLLAARGLGPFDQDGALAATGQADPDFVAQVLTHSYFAQTPPKSLDRDHFKAVLHRTHALSTENALASLATITVASVQAALPHLPCRPHALLVTGGGRKNQSLMQGLAKALPCKIAPVEAYGLDGDALEAQAFAYLALRTALGLPISAPGTTGVPHPATGGRISGQWPA